MKKVKEVLKCDKCNLSTNDKGSFIRHQKSCDLVNDNLVEILKGYENGKSLNKIREEFKVSFTLLKRVFKIHNIKIRSISESLKKINHLLEFNKCDKCNLSTDNRLSFTQHKKSCDMVNNNIEKIINDYENGKSSKAIMLEYRISYKLLKRFLIKHNIRIRSVGELITGKDGHKHSPESRKRMSEARKKFLRENPDKHPWKNKRSKKSPPCETLKEKLSDNNINFVEEYSPSLERHFSIDIAFPDSKIGIEVNGNQHYNRDGSLKDYYKERSDFIEGLGWELIELPYIMVYNDEVVSNLIKMVSDKSVSIERCEEIIREKDLEIKINKELNENKCIDCDTEVTINAKRCDKCDKLTRRKVKTRPPLSQLLKEVEETSYLAVGRKYGVSDNAIRKWIKSYQI